MRARRQHAAAEDPAALLNFSRFLLKASEHTWGSDGRCMEPHAGGDVTSWSNEAFEKARPLQTTAAIPLGFDLRFANIPVYNTRFNSHAEIRLGFTYVLRKSLYIACAS